MEGNGFSRISLLYQAMTNKYKRCNLLEQYSVVVEKEQWDDFYTAGYYDRVTMITFKPVLISND